MSVLSDTMEPMTRLGSAIPLVGRSAELGRLREALTRADDGQACGVVVAGEAGIGKTRLITALSEHAEGAGALVLTGRCLDIAEHELPYLAFTDALSPLAGDAALADKPALARLLPQVSEAPRPDRAVLPSVPGAARSLPDRQLGQLQLFDAVLALLTDLAADRTVVLVIEDLHWADSSTRDLLSFLLARISTERVLVVASYRTDDVHRAHPIRKLLTQLTRMPSVTRVELEPLSDVDSAELIEQLSERPLERMRINDIIVRAEGNAFYTEELLASSLDCDELPDGLADVLLTRLERLSAPTQRIVRLASVAEGRVSHQALSEVSDVAGEELDAALREAVYHHVLVVEGEYYRFRHALLREAVYGDLLPGERARIHAAYAARLVGKTSPRVAALLAYHSLESNDLPTALSATLQAADEAERRGAPDAALNNIERALRIWHSVAPEERPADVDELKILHEAAYFSEAIGQRERAIGYGKAAVELLDGPAGEGVSPERAAKVWRAYALALDTRSSTQWDAIDAIEKAWKIVEHREPSRARSWVLADRAQMYRGVNRHEEAVASAQAAVEDAKIAGVAGAEADALITLAIVAEFRGELEQARERLVEAERKAVEARTPNTELRALFSRALSHNDAGEFDVSRQLYERAVRRAKETGLQSSAIGIALRTHVVGLDYVTGQWPDESPVSADHGGSAATVDALTAAYLPVLVARGDFDRAHQIVDDLSRRWSSDFMIALAVGAARSELAQWESEHRQALDGALEAIDWLESFEAELIAGIRLAAIGLASAVELAVRARSAGDAGAEADAVEKGRKLLQHARHCVEHGFPRTGELGPEGRAWLARAEAEASGLEAAPDVKLWQQAVTEFGYGAVYEQAVARYRFADVLLAAGRGDEAADELRAAAQVAERLEARPLLDGVQQLARRARIKLGDQPVRQRTTDLFTARERSVLELVADGKTNRQIGDELFISEKTVSVHLSRAMAKLGATRRAEAVAIAYDKGLL